MRALLVHPLLAVCGTVAALVLLAIAGESSDAAVTGAYLVPLSAATIATGLAVMRRGRGPVAGLLLSVATAVATAIVIGTILLVLIVLAAAEGAGFQD